MVKIIALANLKGGTGKTNVAVNLSMFLSALGKRVLLIDLTPQGDATFSLGIKSSPNYVGDVLLQKIRPKLAVKSTPYFAFDIMPSFPELISAIGRIRELRKPEARLKEAIEKMEEDYDFVIIDTCPDFNILTLNALYAADEIMIPIQSEYLALRNANQLVSMIHSFRPLKEKEISAVLTMYGWRSKISRSVSKAIKNEFSGYIYNTVIPRTAILSQITESKEPILKSAPNSRASRAFKQLAEEVLSRTR
ncbi:ParA family protein [Patescibacteria group bacterium]|nr:ParA family protein [Patescibacteria group bacterium]